MPDVLNKSNLSGVQFQVGEGNDASHYVVLIHQNIVHLHQLRVRWCFYQMDEITGDMWYCGAMPAEMKLEDAITLFVSNDCEVPE